MDKPWNWYYVSMNPSITWKFVFDNLDKPWQWAELSLNTFGRQLPDPIAMHKAHKIANMCRKHIMEYCWNPARPLGQYLITTEFETIDNAK